MVKKGSKEMDKFDKIYIADFETINRDGDEEVWLWDMCCEGKHEWGYDIASFMSKLLYTRETICVKFHNLKFDGAFILDHLLKNGYEYNGDGGFDTLSPNEFNVFISGKGVFYSLSLINRLGGKILINDSYKIIPMSVANMAKTFGLQISKGEIDYLKPRPRGYIATQEELDYIWRDTAIVEQCYKILADEGMTKSTVSGCAMAEYKRIVGKKFHEWFGTWGEERDLQRDGDIRASYRGGFVQVNKMYSCKTIKRPVYYYDVNSMYPYVMTHYPLPYGEPVKYEGKYVYDPQYPLYIQRIYVDMVIKDGCVSHILDKMTLNDYINDTEGVLELTLTKPDLERIYDNFEIFTIEYKDGYKFQAQTGMFDEYVTKHYEGKAEAKANGNKGKCMIHKLYLNSLYGKFGEHPQKFRKIPYIEDNKVKYSLSKEESQKPYNYLPVATFVTAWARHYLLSMIDFVGMENFVYSDTDCIMTMIPLPDRHIDNEELGKFKKECTFKKLKVIGAKTYWGMTVNKEIMCKACGCSQKALKNIPLGRFNCEDEGEGRPCVIKNGRITAEIVPGGRRIVVKDYVIRYRL